MKKFLNIHIHNRKMRHLIASSKQEAVYKDFKNIISRLMLENTQIKDDELSRRIRNSKYPKLLCDLYSSALTELLRQWLEHKYEISPEALVDFIESEFIGC
ncbi:TetR family transcriptional regulator C-terminal domain-containing protein [Staphylococcus sp. ACRSN]|uniref:TetR-like C-terminal domain-containing protein n=1 Tax=Staphylococcus sp. ACRSN TaxID=2918214 RepID=UPI001EF3770F|nr:TetR-like C-terminal domain-containing protein [Staphylococcus sp. ACRSN]MCG7338871.1 TetR family transcriptional regulator C-terminal domain-containing protein [Staphylococcus sp. ACRSN]